MTAADITTGSALSRGGLLSVYDGRGGQLMLLLLFNDLL